MRSFTLGLVPAFFLMACSQAPATSDAVSEAASAVGAAASSVGEAASLVASDAGAAASGAVDLVKTRAELVDCAGAMASAGKVDPTKDPSTGTKAENDVFTVLALMDKTPEKPGMTGRAEVAAAKLLWDARPEAERTEKAAACTARYAGG